MLSISVAILLVTLISPAHADEQNTCVQIDAAPIENPPLPRPKPPLRNATDDNPAVLISAFRHQLGEHSVVISAALTRVAHEQANAMAMRNSLDHDALAPFSAVDRFSRTSRQSATARREVDWRCTCTKWPQSLLGNGHRREVKVCRELAIPINAPCLRAVASKQFINPRFRFPLPSIPP
jgi:hypothetical protein